MLLQLATRQIHWRSELQLVAGFCTLLDGICYEGKVSFLFSSKSNNQIRGHYEYREPFIEENGIEWTKLGSLCTDDAPAMMGKQSGFVAMVKKSVPTSLWQTVCSIAMPCDQDAPQGARWRNGYHCWNSELYPRSCSQPSPLQGLLWRHWCCIHSSSVLHRDALAIPGPSSEPRPRVRSGNWNFPAWERQRLGGLLQRPYLRREACVHQRHFRHLNALNISLQGSGVTIVEAAERINSLGEKLRLWSNRA